MLVSGLLYTGLEIVFKYINDYLISPTHAWWVEKVWKPSWTKFLSWTAGIPAVLVSFGQYVSSFMQDNTIQMYMAQFDIPNWVPSSLALISLIYYIASGRN